MSDEELITPFDQPESSGPGVADEEQTAERELSAAEVAELFDRMVRENRPLGNLESEVRTVLADYLSTGLSEIAEQQSSTAALIEYLNGPVIQNAEAEAKNRTQIASSEYERLKNRVKSTEAARASGKYVIGEAIVKSNNSATSQATTYAKAQSDFANSAKSVDSALRELDGFQESPADFTGVYVVGGIIGAIAFFIIWGASGFLNAFGTVF